MWEDLLLLCLASFNTYFLCFADNRASSAAYLDATQSEKLFTCTSLHLLSEAPQYVWFACSRWAKNATLNQRLSNPQHFWSDLSSATGPQGRHLLLFGSSWGFSSGNVILKGHLSPQRLNSLNLSHRDSYSYRRHTDVSNGPNFWLSDLNAAIKTLKQS